MIVACTFVRMAATGDLRSLLGPAIFNLQPDPSHCAGRLLQYWTNHTDTLRTREDKVEFESDLMDDDVCFQIGVGGELQAQVEEQNTKLADFTQQSEKGWTALQHYM